MRRTHPAAGRAVRFRILERLAQQAVDTEGGAEGDVMLSTKALHMDLRGGSDDPSKWFSTPWKQLLAEEPGRREALEQVARELGLQVVPVLQRQERGKLAYYGLAAQELAPAQATEPSPRAAAGEVSYLPDAVKTWRWMRWLSVEDGQLRVRMWSMVVLLLLMVGSVGFAAWALALAVGGWLWPTGRLQVWDLMAMAGMLVVAWQSMRTARSVWDLVDLRIVMLPWWAGWGTDDGLTLEIRKSPRQEGDDRPNVFARAQYTATCAQPGCGGQVGIRKGRGEFRGRLVGVCGRSPREHIFSFDHVAKVGHRLR